MTQRLRGQAANRTEHRPPLNIRKLTDSRAIAGRSGIRLAPSHPVCWRLRNRAARPDNTPPPRYSAVAARATPASANCPRCRLASHCSRLRRLAGRRSLVGMIHTLGFGCFGCRFGRGLGGHYHCITPHQDDSSESCPANGVCTNSAFSKMKRDATSATIQATEWQTTTQSLRDPPRDCGISLPARQMHKKYRTALSGMSAVFFPILCRSNPACS